VGEQHLVAIDEWGQDWDEGPRRALLDLNSGLKAVRTPPLVLFDQVDDYQARHREQFHAPGGALVRLPREIEEASPYWRELGRLVRERKIRILFIVRSDAASSVDALKFVEEPRSFELRRLSSEFVGPLLETLTQPRDGHDVVSDPWFGWDRLKDRLCEDLQTKGLVLPIQISVALRALRSLPSLTPEAYARAGGMRGLEALAIERAAAEVATAVRLDRSAFLAVLTRLVDREKEGTVPATFDELSEVLSLTDRPFLERALVMLEDREIVRRSAVHNGSRAATWVLDHDFLWRGVVEAGRRLNRWQSRLDDLHRAWSEARCSIQGWWGTLIDPWTQFVLLFQRLRGRVRYGAKAAFAAWSLLRFAPYAMALVLLVLGGRWFLDQRDTEKAQGFLRAIGGTETIEKNEWQQLYDLAEQPRSVRWKFLELGLRDPASAGRILTRAAPVARATVGLDSSMRDDVLKSIILPTLSRQNEPMQVRQASIAMGIQLGARRSPGFVKPATASILQDLATK
jgi:hypothetical protein